MDPRAPRGAGTTSAPASLGPDLRAPPARSARVLVRYLVCCSFSGAALAAGSARCTCSRSAGKRGPARPLPAVRGHDRRGGQRRAARRRRSAERTALAGVDKLDLSRPPGTSCPTPTSSPRSPTRRGAGSTATPTRAVTELRRELARRLAVEPERDRGRQRRRRAAQLAPRALLEPGDELLTPWPSYPLLPADGRRAHGAARCRSRAATRRAAQAVTPRTRVIASATRTTRPASYSPPTSSRRLLDALPEHVTVLLDEALVEFVDRQPARTPRWRCSTTTRDCSSSARFCKA